MLIASLPLHTNRSSLEYAYFEWWRESLYNKTKSHTHNTVVVIFYEQ